MNLFNIHPFNLKTTENYLLTVIERKKWTIEKVAVKLTRWFLDRFFWFSRGQEEGSFRCCFRFRRWFEILPENGEFLSDLRLSVFEKLDLVLNNSLFRFKFMNCELDFFGFAQNFATFGQPRSFRRSWNRQIARWDASFSLIREKRSCVALFFSKVLECSFERLEFFKPRTWVSIDFSNAFQVFKLSKNLGCRARPRFERLRFYDPRRLRKTPAGLVSSFAARPYRIDKRRFL